MPGAPSYCRDSGLVAEWTGLEPATPGVTGRYSNQLNYHSSNLYTPRAGDAWRPLGDSNPCNHRERVVSWASRRRGLRRWSRPICAGRTASDGGGKRDRTADLLHAMQALSQLSYTPFDSSRAEPAQVSGETAIIARLIRLPAIARAPSRDERAQAPRRAKASAPARTRAPAPPVQAEASSADVRRASP